MFTLVKFNFQCWSDSWRVHVTIKTSRIMIIKTDVGQTDSSVVPEVVTAAPSGSLFLLESPVQNSPGVTSVFLVGEQKS